MFVPHEHTNGWALTSASWFDAALARDACTSGIDARLQVLLDDGTMASQVQVSWTRITPATQARC